MENYDLTSDRGVYPAMITLFNFMQEKRGKEDCARQREWRVYTL